MNEKNACQQAQDMEEARGKRHGHIRAQIDEHFNCHYHGHICQHDEHAQTGAEISSAHEFRAHAARHEHNSGHFHSDGRHVLTVRSHSGISGDMLLTGLAILNLRDIAPDGKEGQAWLRKLCSDIMPELSDCLNLRRHSIDGVCGWQALVKLPHEHEHRSLADIKTIIDNAEISAEAKKRAGLCFELLAACEASAHDIEPGDVHFHEVGALDSILDICGVCELYVRLGAPELICGPLPVADGEVACAHGILPAPAPAVLRLLQDVPVRPFAGHADAGELLTPTGIALLRALDVKFGPWPAFHIGSTVLVYGQRKFANAPNGVIFAYGD